ncbi:MAG TPA: hypothetical protein VGD46_04100 [Rhizobacter sp.]
MSKVWKVLALLLVITALVWLTTLWRWQSAQVNPDATQLLLQLALLPVLLTAALLGTVWSVKRLRAYAAAPAVVPAAKAAAAAPAATAPSANAPAVPPRVLAAAVQLRSGANWQDAQSRIAEGVCKAELDPAMKDDDGIAIFTAPVSDLVADDIGEALSGIVATRRHALPADWVEQVPAAEVLRALSLLNAVAGPMADAIEVHWPALAVPLPSQRAANGTPAHPPLLPPVVSIRVGIPARWPLPVRQLASVWLQDLFAPHIDAGLQAAGQSHAMASAARPAVQLHVHPVESAEAYWLLMEQQLQQWQREKQPGLLWAVVTDSLVGPDAVEQLSRTRELFSGRHQQGRVPGEAAAGLLLASAAWRMPADADPPMALLHQASIARRDKSADASGRISSQTLMQALDDTLRGTAVDAALVQHLTTDADHRATRTAEVYEVTQEKLPHLDASQHALRLGLGCGDTGVARLVACAALTATQVQESQAPALLLATHSPFDRLSVLMAPPTPPTPPASAAAPAAAQAA